MSPLAKTALILSAALLTACVKDSPNRPTRRWPPPGSAAYQAAPNGVAGPVRPSTAQTQTLLGPAVTPFGLIPAQQRLGFFQFPAQWPSQWPALPTLTDWSSIPFPLPWAAPVPTGTTPQAGSDGWPPEWSAVEDEVLRQTNERRAMGASCGGQMMSPAGPLSPHGSLRGSARGHSRDMATRDYFDHTSPEGKGPSNRAMEAGYQGSFVGENIAAGQTDPTRVVQAWMESPGHCLNIMDPRYRVLGVGYFFDNGDRFGHYWTQNFGS